MEQLEAVDAAHAGVVDAAIVARALALLDRGLVAEARELLAEALPVSAPARLAAEEGALARLHDAELESAFDDARPETESMIDADGIAFDAIVRARLDDPENVSLPAPDSPFHTHTMADLLERQGDAKSARAIRSALGAGEAGGTPRSSGLDADVRVRTIQTLERWLARLRGGDA